MSSTTLETPVAKTNQPRALRILAKSVFRELKSSGYTQRDIVAFSTEVLALVRTDISEEGDTAEAQ